MVAHRSREVLVIHPGALGDVLQAVPALTALRALDDHPRLTFAGQSRLGRFLVGVRLVDEALTFDGLGLEALFTRDPVPSSLRAWFGRFDGVISWFGARADPFSESLGSLVPDALIAQAVPATGPPPTVWEHLLATLAPWGVKAPMQLRCLAVPEAWREEASLALSRLGADRRRPLLVVHPGAGGEWKRWPAEAFARVIRQVVSQTDCQVVVHEGPADRHAVDELDRALELTAARLREPPLDVLAGVLRDAAAYLGSDSGVSHLAAAVGTPAVIVFPSATIGRWAPWSPTAFPVAVASDGGEIGVVARLISASLSKACSGAAG